MPQSETLSQALDAYAPAEIARRVEGAGVAKAQLPALKTFILALLAGVYIGFGAMLYCLVMVGADAGSGSERLLGAIAFSLGLVLVLIAGAELFTGNALIVLACAQGRVTLVALLRNWSVVLLGNASGALILALVAWRADLGTLMDGGFGSLAAQIADAKLAIGPEALFWRAILCNILVCLAVWMTFSAHSVAGKILCIVFPVAGFVALGLEHSIANLFLVPYGLMVSEEAGRQTSVWLGFLPHLTIVICGNMVGGGLLLALVYRLIYRT